MRLKIKNCVDVRQTILHLGCRKIILELSQNGDCVSVGRITTIIPAVTGESHKIMISALTATQKESIGQQNY